VNAVIGPTRRERKRHTLRQHIVEVAMSLFDTEGYNAISMERIAAAADVAKGTLYKHFPVKEAIVATFMSRMSSTYDEAVNDLMARVPDTEGRLLALFEGFAAWAVQHREYMAAYTTYRLSDPRWYAVKDSERSGFHRHLLRVLTAGVAADELRAELPVELAVIYLQSLQLAATLRWLQQTETELPDLLRQVVRLFLDGVRRAS
jgi:AcrR family transcriptional regulator